MTILDWLNSATGELFKAGLAGSAVAAAMEWSGVLPAIRKIFVGTICALYLSPIAVPLLEWVLGTIQVPRDQAAGVSGFLMGVVGIIVIEILLKAFRLRRDDLQRKNGGGPNKGEKQP